MSSEILKCYANLDGYGQTHYRQSRPKASTGKPLIMLHPSPMSSELMVPLINHLGATTTIFAPDTPGYGMSDPLTDAQLSSADDLSPYVEWLSAFIDCLGLDQVGIYGTATGSQIAIEFARSYPEKTQFLILDNAAHFSDQAREDIISRYFPSIEPQADGSHLRIVWEMAQGLFQWFPWYAQDEEHRVSDVEPSAQAVHATAMAYLAAGNDYAQAYRRAFYNENAGRLQSITEPVRVIRWHGSIIKKYADQFDDFEWPSNVQMVHCGPEVAERYAAIEAAVQEFSNAEDS